ncbi:DMT family transporter [Ancylobacter mangrovi]|uniref:Guanidinium exporter n=1 Tax=Ancylobacter mangrovi TaxID=2972472 RepID=A0A9X2PEI9_9HYPH|nr:multidrug efflux SMR transporter [Ancylobacter mangrovi]MCS0495934.1 multidrug efflux SMR transporter [Ancylobacter mangrovi]MCS0504649.1 multidrug efflux SMR transporter [Ancylobacter mangrovi]
MAWVYLGIAGLLEVVFAMSMKNAEGFTRLVPSLITGATGIAGFICLGLALKDLPVSVAYPVWTAIGTLGTVLFGTLMLGETLSVSKLVCLAMIVIGISGLKAAV